MRWYPLCCPVTDVAAASDAAVKGATDVAATAAADAGTAAAVDAGTAALGAGALDAGTAALGAGADAALASSLPALGAGGVDAATQAAIDAGFTSASSSLGESALAGAAAQGGGIGTAATSVLPAAGEGAAAPAGAAAAGADTLAPVTISSTALPAAGGAGGGVGEAIQAALPGLAGLPAVAGPGGGAPTAHAMDAGGDNAPPPSGDSGGDIVETSVTPGYFASTGDPLSSTFGTVPPGTDPGILEPGLGNSLNAAFTQDLGLGNVGDFALDPSIANAADPGSLWSQLLKYSTTPKGLLTEGMLGTSLMTALSKPKLPGGAAEAGALAGPAAAQASSTIETGGYGAPQWNQQKSSIDASINQQIQNITAALTQSGINAGMGGPRSGITQEQIASQVAQLENQRQLLYAQALQQNVNNAVSELTGANQTLMAVASLQYQQSEEARRLAAQLAETAAQLNFGGRAPSGTHS